jgi:hypothetical protein
MNLGLARTHCGSEFIREDVSTSSIADVCHTAFANEFAPTGDLRRPQILCLTNTITLSGTRS